MNFLNKLKFPALAGILFVVGLMSCEQDLTTIGSGVIGGEPFTTNKVEYDVFAYNKKIVAVQTNKLPLYQLGVFDDPIYGKTEAQITTQVQLSVSNPTFGDLTQAFEVGSDANAVVENERIDSVFIYIPFQTNKIDTDNDGVVDSLDEFPSDATNDTDNDGVPNNEEVANNTDPNNVDTDGDGINDGVDESTLGDRFAKTFRLDSIYGDRTQPFNLKVERSTFFLRDLDPNSNFQDAQEFFSSQEFSPSFVNEVFYDDEVSINAQEVLFIVKEDDPDTVDVDEIGTIESKLDPGIYVRLNSVAETFFQNNILDKEGSLELLSPSNFKEFFRGVHLSLTPTDENLLLLLDITKAKFNIHYTYNNKVDDGTEEEQKTFELRFITQSGNNPISGNAVNTFINEDYPVEITNSLDSGENAANIYLKGGAGSYAEIQLFDEVEEDAEILINQIKANNWIINEANIVFYVDKDAMPISAIEPPRLYLYNGETNAPLYNTATENNEANTPLGIYLNYGGLLEKSGDKGVKYTFKITEYINDIIIRDSTNVKLGLSVTPDIRVTGANNTMLFGGIEKDIPASSVLSPLGTVLFGNNVSSGEEGQRLKLEIFYTETN